MKTPPRDEINSPRPRLLLACLVAIGFFCFFASDLARMQFASASENVVVQAALEIRQGGPSWIPNLHGRPRITKPPLTTWITAAVMSQGTVDELSSRESQVRHSAYRRLAFQARWPAALSTALTILGVYILGSLLLGADVGLVAMVMAGTTLLLFRYGRTATTDVQITLWVTWTNVCLAAALTGRNRWFIALAGVPLGLAVMSKGPVAIAQSLLPAAIYLACLRSRALSRSLVLPTVSGGLMMLAISLPWPLSILLQNRKALGHWFREITRVGATHLEPDPWYGYLNLVPNMMPWAPLFVAGLCVPLLARLRSRGAIFAWLLFMVPLLVMSFASDKPERYALPLVAPAAILAAHIAAILIRSRPHWNAGDKLVIALQWLILFIFPAILVAGSLWRGSAIGFEPWVGVAVGVLGLFLAAGAWIRRNANPWSVIIATALCALMIYPLTAIAYSVSRNGQGESRLIADQLVGRFPEFRAYYYDPRQQPRHIPTDMGIYLNRPVMTISHPSQIAPGPTPALVLMLQRRGDPMPVCPGGELELSEPIDKYTCHVFRMTSPNPPASIPGTSST